jgi:hypothetical protein
MRTTLLAIFIVLAMSAQAFASSEDSLHPEAQRLQGLLSTRCSVCHIDQGFGSDIGLIKKFGDFLKHGVLQRYVDRTDPRGSVLYQQIQTGRMPFQFSSKDQLGPKEKADLLDAVEKWIRAGAPELEAKPSQPPLRTREIENLIAADLARQPQPQDVRYITLTNTFNNPETQALMPTYIEGLNKLVNSLSWQAKLKKLTPLNPTKTVLRLNLSDYGWDQQTWKSLQVQYPYISQITSSPVLTEVAKKTKAIVPVLRGDWFIFTASSSINYYNILRMPEDEKGLEKLVGLNTTSNILAGKVVRAGFGNSGVSLNNRVIERHPLLFGSYWKSYDFGSNEGAKNIFLNPLGPREVVPGGFNHDGGEIIFNLPNGLQAYFLSTNTGARLNKGPTQIVTDPYATDRAVNNGVSCMRCHVTGMISRNDEISQTLGLGGFGNMSVEERAKIKSLYRGEFVQNILQKDAAVYVDAINKLDGDIRRPDPVSYVADLYSKSMDRNDIISDIGLSKEQAASIEKQSENSPLKQLLLVSKLGVKRDFFETYFDMTFFPQSILTLNQNAPTTEQRIQLGVYQTSGCLAPPNGLCVNSEVIINDSKQKAVVLGILKTSAGDRYALKQPLRYDMGFTRNMLSLP